MSAPTGSYDTLAAALLAAPDPVKAIAHLIGDHEGRLDALARRVHSLEARDIEARTRPIR